MVGWNLLREDDPFDNESYDMIGWLKKDDYWEN